MPLISTILNIGVILIKMAFKRHAWMRSKRQARTHGIEQSKVLYNLEQILNFQYLVFHDRESTLGSLSLLSSYVGNVVTKVNKE